MRSLLLFSLFLAISFSSCLEDSCTRHAVFVQMVPVYVTEEGLRPDVTVKSARLLEHPGKIYSYNQYLFINELREGVHVIDNTDPAHPISVAFIEIPGNIDISIKDNLLYADMYRDLVTIDISDIKNAHLVDRQLNVFEAYIPYDETQGKYIVHYEESEENLVLDCNDDRASNLWFRTGPEIFFNTLSTQSFGADRTLPGNFQSVGTGGSLARFTIAKDHLYALDDQKLNIYDIEDGMPIEGKTLQINWGIETIFPLDNNLFIGANDGLYIYSIENPDLPEFQSRFSHARACDPVFVDGDIAYVTLRSGGPCVNQVNQIDIIDVSNLKFPKLIRSIRMQNPHGLSVLNDVLFLCEGEFGFKVFDVAIPRELDQHLLSHIRSHHSWDVIALSSGVIMVIGDEGLFQYDITNPSAVQLLSSIQIVKN